MNRKTLWTFLYLLFSVFILENFVLTENAFSQQTKRVLDVQIRGNKAISTVTILNRLKLRTGDVFEAAALNNELKRLYAMGYFADVSVETEDRPEGVIVVFTVIEKPIIGRIDFRGNARVKTVHLLKKIFVKEGTLLDYSLLAQDVSAIRQHYVEQGYSRVDIDYRIDSDPITQEAVVVFLINEGLPLKIASVEIEGNLNFTDNEIKKYMATKPAWWFLQKGNYDEDEFRADLDRIRSMYRSKGFLDARVEEKFEYSPEGDRMYITVVVDEGTKYLVGDIELKGELAFPKSAIRGLTKVRPADPFDYTKIKEDIDSIRAFYYDRGYMNVELDMINKYNPGTSRMDLAFNITAHEEVYVGKVNIIGNTKTKDIVIRRELRVYPGMKYDGQMLKLSKERVYNLGFFEDVYFEPVPTDEKNVKDLNVTVKESKTGELSFGGGYSSIQAFVGFAQVRQKNFDALNFPYFMGAGQDLIVRAELGSARTNYFLSWTDPWIMGYPYLFGFDIYREEYNKFRQSGYGYDERRTGASLRLGKELTDNLYTGLKYNLEEVKISNIPIEATSSLTRERGTNTISRLTWNLNHDTRDNKFSPSRGWTGGITVENAGGFIGGNKDFVKGVIAANYYHSLFKNIVLELRGQTGMVENYANTDEVPIYERFFAGGTYTIRGYKERGVGPRDPGTNTALGGEAVAIGNAEVVFPIFKNVIKGAVFYDVGNVWEEKFDIFEVSEYKQGAGVGVRIKTPIGPVKLDWGYPLSENHGDKREGRFYFSVTQGF